MKKHLLNIVVAMAALTGSTVSNAQQLATTTDYLNLRAGPHHDFPVVAILPRAATVVLYGCLADFFWCDVGYGPDRGWLYAAYLSYPYRGQPVVIAEYGPVIGLQILTFSVGAYWGAYYANRSWYYHRDHWHNWHYYPSPRPPGVRPPGSPPGRPPGTGPGHPPGRPPAAPPAGPGRPPGYRPERPPAGQPPGRPPSGAQPPARPPGGAQPPARPPGGAQPPGSRPAQAVPRPSGSGNAQSRGGSR